MRSVQTDIDDFTVQHSGNYPRQVRLHGDEMRAIAAELAQQFVPDSEISLTFKLGAVGRTHALRIEWFADDSVPPGVVRLVA